MLSPIVDTSPPNVLRTLELGPRRKVSGLFFAREINQTSELYQMIEICA
jgi:hypothetical protein